MPRLQGPLLLVAAAVLGLPACAGAKTEQAPAQAVDAVAEPAAAEPAATPGAACEGLVLGASHEIADPELREISGAVQSQRSRDAIWVHEDSSNPTILSELSLDGSLLSRWLVPGVDMNDWEDLAAARAADGSRHLFIGDIGDNLRQRSSIAVLRLPEPGSPDDAAAQPPGYEGVTAPPAVITLSLPDGPRDAEALLVDPRSGDLLVVTKEITGRAELLVAPAAAWAPHGTTVELELAGQLPLGPGGAVLAGDISPDGGLVALRTPWRVLLWERPAQASVAETLLDRPGCRAPATWDLRGEALALLDGGGYALTGEGARASLQLVTPSP